MGYKLLTKKDWVIIMTALRMAAADEWDEGSYGERPDFEAVMDKIERKVGHD
jgi:hypothetical protein